MSPYVVTTWTENVSSAAHAEGYTQEIQSRQAAATLDEARQIAADSTGDPFVRIDAERLPESGGTVGPLPDGTVIEVQRVDLVALIHGAGGVEFNATEPQIIAAFNAAQEAIR